MTNFRSTNPENAIDVRVLYDLFKEHNPGDVVTYKAMQDRVPGRKFMNGDRPILTSARKMLLRNDRIVTRCDPKVGIKILGDAGIVGIGDEASTKIRRISRRAAKEISCVKDFNALPKDLQAKHNASLGLLGAVSLMSEPKRRTFLESQCADKQIATHSVLKLFAGESVSPAEG